MALTDWTIGKTPAEVRAIINGNNLKLAGAEPRLYGKKLVTLGDSITANGSWQPTVAAIKGLVWSTTETATGTGGHKPMGVASATIQAQYSSGPGHEKGDSIYSRADDVHFYSPDVIILFGGTNDFLGGDLGTDISEAAYTGEDILYTENPPSFIASYKGTLLKLVSQNKTARIYATSLLYNYTTPLTHEWLLKYVATRDLIRSLCDLYAVTFIDIMTGSNMNPWNNDLYSPEVHPNADGGVRLGEYIASQLV